MPTDDYTLTPSTGKLKIKGVKDSRVSRKKKCKPPKDDKSADIIEDNSVMLKKLADKDLELTMEGQEKQKTSPELETEQEGNEELGGRVKTEAERRYDEQRRKRVCLIYICICNYVNPPFSFHSGRVFVRPALVLLHACFLCEYGAD